MPSQFFQRRDAGLGAARDIYMGGRAPFSLLFLCFETIGEGAVAGGVVAGRPGAGAWWQGEGMGAVEDWTEIKVFFKKIDVGCLIIFNGLILSLSISTWVHLLLLGSFRYALKHARSLDFDPQAVTMHAYYILLPNFLFLLICNMIYECPKF